MICEVCSECVHCEYEEIETGYICVGCDEESPQFNQEYGCYLYERREDDRYD